MRRRYHGGDTLRQDQFDLRDLARRAAAEEGFEVDFAPAVRKELRSLDHVPVVGDAGDGVRDLRDLLWSSVDNDDSLDLDQLEVADALPDDRIRIRVAIADVDWLVHKGTHRSIGGGRTGARLE